ncbi:hypothetical protein [Helicobacter salomonis]|nr:hypothetical protein [Helicobacter salomonis]
MFLEHHSPAIQIEIFDKKYSGVSDILRSYGYKMVEKIGSADYVFLKK